ncbi:hypothetical protein A9259_16780 [Vibrio cyclitrophicus]|uniref:glycosyltransferase family 4 protein n=1 Tax=Vibrio cyclitrophicus TaxID=47951 RepID=UPI0007EECEF5|nr:glycosyltransferase family 4 protein [Vibrio cyclitrophicus]OBS93546.1 hypothetical protein A9259_16780 [Vibrio cyclitrophicus]
MKKRSKKIVIVSFTFFPELNGVANVAFSHAKFLASSGYDVEVITSNSSTTGNFETLPKGISITRFDLKGSFKFHDLIRGDFIKCCKYVNSLMASAVYFHAWESWSTDICLFFNNSKSKLVIFSHGVSYKGNFSSFPRLRKFLLSPYRLIVPYLLRKADRVVLLSDVKDNDRFYDSSLLAKHKEQDKGFVLPNFCPNFYHEYPSNDSLDIELPSDYYVCVSNFQNLKNQEELIKLLSEIPDINLVLVGSSQTKYYSYLQRLAKELSVMDRVYFVVGISHESSMKILSNAKAFLLSSKTECFPLCVLESLSLDIPVISSNVGCLHAIDGVLIYESFQEFISLVEKVDVDLDYYNFVKSEIKEVKTKYSEDSIRKQLLEFTEAIIYDQS